MQKSAQIHFPATFFLAVSIGKGFGGPQNRSENLVDEYLLTRIDGSGLLAVTFTRHDYSDQDSEDESLEKSEKNVTYVGQTINAYGNLFGKTKGRRHLVNLTLMKG